eukprot:CAMPEP_0113945518 /NCGR_PEP_ID=MMETSP1339-20121228/47331_1 /TAXON_ID=94617 /ORGANISM="Fibrocapsa japonica" /LENGTH=86 /DNA_ID=CAMNT_0000951143 /DNA_START=334 /DNA_END=590 /DNA_ORIENTATION=+ /assembly_acc=CAM_ASM_000762
MCPVLAPAALEGHLAEVGNGHQTALAAHVHPVGVTVGEEAVPEEVGAPVRNQAVALHLPHTQPPVLGAPLHGLAGEHGHGAAGPAV